MATQARKQREIEARERLILDVAEHMVEERGYLGMNMDLIAQETDYAKGTIYQHFSCKEEVLAAITDRMAGERVRLFERASTFRARPRERMVAIGLSFDLFLLLRPIHFRIEQIVTADSIRAKTPPARLESLAAKELACQGIVTGIVRDAIAQGDLVLEGDVSPQGLVAGLWMLTYGGLGLLLGKPDLGHLGLDEPQAVLFRNQNALLDGYGWRPLTREWDWAATRHRAMVEVFPDEARQAGLL